MLTFAWIYEDTFWLWRSIFKSKAGESKIVLAKILVESRSVLLGKGEGAVQQPKTFFLYMYMYMYVAVICIFYWFVFLLIFVFVVGRVYLGRLRST